MSEPITGDLIPGRWYRITEISPDDPNPTLKVDDIVECKADSPKCIDPDSMADDGANEWFADYQGDGNGFGTIVSKVEEVARPAQ